MELEVHKAKESDVYKDTVRIHEAVRGDIHEGQICKLSVSGKSKLVAIRGVEDDPKTTIRVDELTQIQLGLIPGQTYSFEVAPVGWVGEWLWAWRFADPAARFAARASASSVVLGIMSALLALWSVYLAFR